MKLDKSTLESYSKIGSTTNSSDTYNSLKSYLENNISDYNFEVYLQGSYANHTNIRGSSDVDIVVNLTQIFSHNINSFSSDIQRDFYSNYNDATVKLSDFRNDVLSVLDNSNYEYEEKNKCIKIISGTKKSADLVISNDYRKYVNYPNYIEGIDVFNKMNEKIYSYPKLHRSNGEDKNKNTFNEFKPMVRIFKNINRYFIDNNIIANDLISSYFIECLIYNVPNEYFVCKSIELRFLMILSYLYDSDKYESMKVVDEQSLLFDSNSKITINDVILFLSKIMEFR